MNGIMEDTICAPASGSGGAICTIRVSGPDTMGIVDSVVSFAHGSASASKGGRVKYGTVDGVDEVVVSIFRAPHSYTGQDSAELGCHASGYIIREILSRLVAAGARMAEPGEFSRRAFLNGKMDLSQAEAVADVIAAESSASHRVAYSQLRGRYSGQLAKLRERLLELTSLLELELDFSEEDVEFADRSKLEALLNECLTHIGALKESYRIGNAIRNGVSVAIVGAPNSGKSTLLNALVGDDRAIVSDVPGTTRDTVEESITLQGIQFRFIDTAGIHDTSDAVERMGIERSLRKISQASTVICLLDGTFPDADNAEILESVAERIGPDQHLIAAVNKSDVHPGSSALPGTTGLPAMGASIPGAIRISALKGDGLDALRAEIVAPYDSAGLDDASIVTSERHFEALRRAYDSLSAAADSLSRGIPGDLVAEDLRDSLHSIGSILGDEITTEEVLGEVFGRFCIGK
ncbi:MAG: tRNA uridine-5-carboxymethylaminomethyl(34) synthesis GTPase MnmE [Bacteroidales bacterium]|nr:tRNA uridine-5-carboxymethylaminomethyl(34) synthesis GTPase MnmE [Bacteroidales bacterium]